MDPRSMVFRGIWNSITGILWIFHEIPMYSHSLFLARPTQTTHTYVGQFSRGSLSQARHVDFVFLERRGRIGMQPGKNEWKDENWDFNLKCSLNHYDATEWNYLSNNN